MPRLKRRLPSYRLHKASGQAVVILNGKDILGPHGSEESRAEYDWPIAEWLANQRQHAPAPVAGVETGVPELTVDELFLAYWEFALGYYVKDGKPTGELEPIRRAAKPLTELYGTTLATQFEPRALETVRQEMIEQGLSRKLINGRVNRIRRYAEQPYAARQRGSACAEYGHLHEACANRQSHATRRWSRWTDRAAALLDRRPRRSVVLREPQTVVEANIGGGSRPVVPCRQRLVSASTISRGNSNSFSFRAANGGTVINWRWPRTR